MIPNASYLKLLNDPNYTEKHLDNIKFFIDHQRLLIKIANSDEGRYLLGIKNNKPVCKVVPNGLHFVEDIQDKKIIASADLWSRYWVAEILRPIIEKTILTYRDFPKINNDPLAVALFQAGLRKGNLPRYLFSNSDIVPAAGDGMCQYLTFTYDFATAHNSASSTSHDDSTASIVCFVCMIQTAPATLINRGFFPVDTSSLTGSAIIIPGGNFFSVMVTNGHDTWNQLSRTATLQESTVASTTGLVDTDYDNFTATELATRYPMNTTSIGSRMNIALNTAGNNFINKIGFTKLCGREGTHDVANSQPPDSSTLQFSIYQSEASTPTDRPYLRVFYSMPSGAFLNLI